MSICEVVALRKEYPNFALRDISFALEEGTITGFIGRNGAGKTTTIKSMLNLVHRSSGEVYYFGMPFSDENEDEIKQRIGFSSGAVNYYPKKKLRDIVDITKLFYKNWDDRAYREYMEMFSLDENKSPLELSDGMKVKCNLMLALSHRAEILILDEPTSSLDPFSRDELTDLFITLKNRGTSIFFSTHITSDLDKCADRIVYIRDGKIVASDTVKNFHGDFSLEGENLEATMLRLEKEARQEKNEKTSL